MRSFMIDEEIGALIQIGKLFESRQWFLGTSGNLSALLSRDPLQFSITASGIDKGNATVDSFVPINDNGEVLSAGSENSVKPSGEWQVHRSIYETTDAKSVIHVHTIPGLLIADLCGKEGQLILKGLEVQKGLGCKSANDALKVNIISNKDDISVLASDVSAVIKSSKDLTAPAVLVRHHGLFAWGDSAFAVKRHVELLIHAFDYLVAKRRMEQG